MTKHCVVLDTNVYLSGIIFGGNSRHIIDLIREGKVYAITSTAILLEVAQKLHDKFEWDNAKVTTTVRAIAQVARVVSPKEKLHVVFRDSSDNKIVETAVEAKTAFIVTGDKHLLTLKKFRKIRIVSPKDFLDIYTAKK